MNLEIKPSSSLVDDYCWVRAALERSQLECIALKEEIKELRNDKERLDWLDQQRYDERNPNDREDDPPAYCVWSIQAQSFSLRETVDAARKGNP